MFEGARVPKWLPTKWFWAWHHWKMILGAESNYFTQMISSEISEKSRKKQKKEDNSFQRYVAALNAITVSPSFNHTFDSAEISDKSIESKILNIQIWRLELLPKITILTECLLETCYVTIFENNLTNVFYLLRKKPFQKGDGNVNRSMVKYDEKTFLDTRWL